MVSALFEPQQVGPVRLKNRTLRAAAFEGIELVAMARPLIRELDFVERLRDEPDARSLCEPCNRCVAAMYHAEQRCP
ncbi:MAG TPA: hypothetical protein ENK57_06925 [Polyangiaceae bacterium]|nr:hypothetical protein [Polyangiaceae bacterium]